MKNGKIVVAVGTDHVGIDFATDVAKIISSMGQFTVVECGSYDAAITDFPIITKDVCNKILNLEAEYGIVIDGSGTGSAMAANKIRGIRAVFSTELGLLHHARTQLNANVMCLSSFHKPSSHQLLAMFRMFFFTEFEYHNRHIRRLSMLEDETDSKMHLQGLILSNNQ